MGNQWHGYRVRPGNFSKHFLVETNPPELPMEPQISNIGQIDELVNHFKFPKGDLTNW